MSLYGVFYFVFFLQEKLYKLWLLNRKKLWNTRVRGYFAFIKNQKKCPIKDERFFVIQKKIWLKIKKIVEYTSERIFCNHRKNQKSFHKKTKKLWNTIVRGV